MRSHAETVSPVVDESSAAIGGGRPHPLAALALALIASVLAVEAVQRIGGAPSDAQRTMIHGGRPRTYLVRDFGSGEPAPVVIVLHGGGGHGENAAQMTGFDRVAAREGVIAVYPNGTAARDRDRFLTWNAGHCCAAAMRGAVDDVGFIGAIVDALVASKRADASRIFVTGMSNGGMLAHRLGRELSSTLAGIAPVVGAIFGDEPPPRAPVPAFVVVGADDRVVSPLAARSRRGCCWGGGRRPTGTLRRRWRRPPIGAATTDVASRPSPRRRPIARQSGRAAAAVPRSSSSASPATVTRGRAESPDTPTPHRRPRPSTPPRPCGRSSGRGRSAAEPSARP